MAAFLLDGEWLTSLFACRASRGKFSGSGDLAVGARLVFHFLYTLLALVQARGFLLHGRVLEVGHDGDVLARDRPEGLRDVIRHAELCHLLTVIFQIRHMQL